MKLDPNSQCDITYKKQFLQQFGSLRYIASTSLCIRTLPFGVD